jgi:inosose dehydratase
MKSMNRRQFAKAVALGSGAASITGALAQKARKLKIGHTGITWGYEGPEQAIHDIASLGFWGFETFGNTIEKLEASGGIGQYLEKANLSLTSAYCSADLVDPAKQKDEMAKMVNWAKLAKKYGAHVIVMGPNGVKRDQYDFNAHKTDIVHALNENAKAITDLGMLAVLHQHTGTCIETRDETYAVLDAVDTNYVKFGPDVGQLAKGGSDPVKVVKDFLPLVQHMHLKDYSGGEHYLGYCPLGQGKVDLATILNMMEGTEPKGRIMVELDSAKPDPMPALEAATIAKHFLEKQGYKFRS